MMFKEKDSKTSPSVKELFRFIFLIESFSNLWVNLFLKQWKKKEKCSKKKKETWKIFSSYYITEKQTKLKQWVRELFRSNVLFVYKQTWEHTVIILLERGWQTFYNEKGTNS